MKAIDTKYNGYKFRSRLEARWAVFFDKLGYDWQYEVEGFDLGDGGLYLPDFKLTNQHGQIQWCEIKPKGTKADAKFSAFEKAIIEKVRRLEFFDFNDRISPAESAQLLAGDPIDALDRHAICPRCGFFSSLSDHWVGEGKGYFDCWPCDLTTPSGGGNPMENGLICPSVPHKGQLIVYPEWIPIYKTRLRKAAETARSARFEHGAAIT